MPIEVNILLDDNSRSSRYYYYYYYYPIKATDSITGNFLDKFFDWFRSSIARVGLIAKV